DRPPTGHILMDNIFLFLQSPQAGTKEKTLCCWLCTSGPISLSAKIERKGYTPGESIQIFAEIENCSSRMVVPKATIYQTQAFYAKGKIKEVKQLIANLRGESLSSGKTETWNGKQLKIPPVSPSILDCSIIRVEYSLMVYVDIPGAMDLFLNLPLVIGTIPLHPFGSRTSSVSSQGSMNMNWLGLTLPERPEGNLTIVLVLAGIGLIFTRSWDGTQPGGIIVVFLFPLYSVKLPLPQPTSFAFFFRCFPHPSWG
uniref:Arrestin C-terminal-like domain-containing protein n=1 Tax=Calidris pygmaea TaxID=425635 RepID=A0A8C3KHP6_9CHAR